MNLRSNITKMGTLDRYYAEFLVSVENLTTSFYKFMGQFNKIAKTMSDPSEFYKHEYSQDYVDSKIELENSILEYQKMITDPVYGIIRTTHLNVEFGYSAFRIVQSEKRVMAMIDGFNTVYTNPTFTEEAYAYAGLSFLESEFNTLSVLITNIIENYPIPKSPENEGEEISEGEESPVEHVDDEVVSEPVAEEVNAKETPVVTEEKKTIKKKRPLNTEA